MTSENDNNYFYLLPKEEQAMSVLWNTEDAMSTYGRTVHILKYLLGDLNSYYGIM